jgi:PhnB protein
MQQNPNWFDNVESRPHPWPGLNWMTAALILQDVDRALDFYTTALGFIPIFLLPGEDGTLDFARLRYRGMNFTLNSMRFDPGLRPPAADQAPSFAFYLYVDDLAQTASAMQTGGATIAIGARREPWGDMRSRLIDPFGYVWDLAQKI